MEGAVVHPFPGTLIVVVTEANPGGFIISDIPNLQEFLGVGVGRGVSEGRSLNATHPMSAHVPMVPCLPWKFLSQSSL